MIGSEYAAQLVQLGLWNVEQKRNVILEACLILEHVIYCHSYQHESKYLQISKILIKQSI